MRVCLIHWASPNQLELQLKMQRLGSQKKVSQGYHKHERSFLAKGDDNAITMQYQVEPQLLHQVQHILKGVANDSHI